MTEIAPQSIPVSNELRAKAHALSGDFDALLDALVSAHVYRCRALPAPPHEPGVYLFAEGDNVLHVGRTKDLQVRRRNQTSPTGDRFVATFPFLLARHRAAEIHSDLPPKREELEVDTRFSAIFAQARTDVREMDFRCVVIADHAQQALFEIFASVALGSRYNFWETH